MQQETKSSVVTCLPQRVAKGRQRSIHVYARVTKVQGTSIRQSKTKYLEGAASCPTENVDDAANRIKRKRRPDVDLDSTDDTNRLASKKQKVKATASQHPTNPTLKAETVPCHAIHDFARQDKRRRSADSDAEPTEDERHKRLRVTVNSTTISANVQKNVAARQPSHIRIPPRKKPTPPTSFFETPTKGARGLFDQLTLMHESLSPPSIPGRSSSDPTPPTSPASHNDIDPRHLPTGLQELIDIYSSLIAALSLHYAHNGSVSLVDVRLLLQSATKIWGKRKVQITDLRMILGISERTRGPDSSARQQGEGFWLSNYGHGKICLEVKDDALSSGTAFHHFISDRLIVRFNSELCLSWQQWVRSFPRSSPPPDPAVFFAQLPLASITPSPCIQQTAPLLAKGHARLEAIKAGPPKPVAPTPSTLPPGPSSPAQPNRALALLERIRAKQAQPSSPCAESSSTSRIGAFQRLDPVLAVLALVAPGTARKSFALPALVTQIRDSMRVPVGKEEVERCLSLLAEEVAPGYVHFVRYGGVVGVVVDPGRRSEVMQRTMMKEERG